MRRFICRIIGLVQLRLILGLSILELTPQEQEEMMFEISGPYQLTLF